MNGDIHHQGGSWPVLTDEQRDRVEANMALVHWHLQRARVRADEYDDRLQDGMLGLIRAAQKYEPGRGFTFATYAMFWIRQAIPKGRGVEQGRSHRSAAHAGVDYNPPLSLDLEYADSGDTLGRSLAVDARVEARGVARALVAEIEDLARRWQLDDIDRAVLAELLTASVEAWRTRERAVAARVGRSQECIRRRRVRLQDRLRDWAGVAA